MDDQVLVPAAVLIGQDRSWNQHALISPSISGGNGTLMPTTSW